MRIQLTKFKALLFLLLSCAFMQTSFAATNQQVVWQHMVWNHIPINIDLPIGREKIIRFPHSVKLGLPASLQSKVVVENDDTYLYITAKSAFPRTRIKVLDQATHSLLLLNLSANQQADAHAISIVYPKAAVEGKSSSGSDITPLGPLAYLQLSHYAVSRLYGNKRFSSNPHNIQLVRSFLTINKKPNMHYAINNLFMDNSMIAMPLDEWFGENYYVTSVLVRNQLPIRLDLTKSIRLLCGRTSFAWRSVGFYPTSYVTKAGTPHDITVLYLVSSKPWSDVIKQCRT